MCSALQTSQSKSYTPLFRRRYIGIVLAALILSLILFWVFRSSEPVPLGNAAVSESGTTTETEVEDRIGIQPPSFQQVTAFSDSGLERLQLSGSAEPNTVIILTDRGKRLRQVRVDEVGQWAATINVEPEGMAIEGQIYTNENLPSIQSEETVFHFPISADENVAEGTYVKSALIMVTAPGAPSRIIQSPFGGVPTSGPLSLSVIDYDYSGGIIITGSSTIPGRIRIYAQDAVIGETGIGVSGRWNYIAGRILPPGAVDIDIRAELIAAPGIPNAPDDPLSIAVRLNRLPPLQAEPTDGSGGLSVSVNIESQQWWQIRRTLMGGGGQSTVIFSPEISKRD